MQLMATNGSRQSRDEWHPARLIPVIGIRGQEEQERRATSVLLAVMQAVPEFGHSLLSDTRAPRGRISTFTEVALKDGDGKSSRPDGAILIERGKTSWSALVEVKTGGALLESDQVGRYLDMAREHGFDALITISPEITANAAEGPIKLDRRKVGKIGVYHLSWWRIMTDAVMQHRHRGVSDPDQAWILGELIAYMDHENSGAAGFQDMGPSWVAVRDGARQGTLRAGAKEVRDVAARWEQFVDYLALGLSQDLGRDVTPVRPRGQTQEQRIDAIAQALAGEGAVSASLKVPNAAAALAVRADLRTRQVTTTTTISAPLEGRPLSRVNWILRQLVDRPTSVRVTTSFTNTRETMSQLLGDAREFPQRLLSPSDPKREPRSFELALTRTMGLKGGKGQGSFIRDTRQHVLDFYGEVVQNLKVWQAPPPRLPDAQRVPESASSEPPAFVDSDQREIGEAVLPPA